MNSIASSKLVLPQLDATSTETPASARIARAAPASKVSGTSAGRGATTEAELRGDVVAEAGRAHLGDRLAAGGDHQARETASPLVAAATRKPSSAWSTSRMRIAPAQLHVAGLAHLVAAAWSTICFAEPSQNSWPSVFSCQAMPWRSTRAMKSAACSG